MKDEALLKIAKTALENIKDREIESEIRERLWDHIDLEKLAKKVATLVNESFVEEVAPAIAKRFIADLKKNGIVDIRG